MAYLESRNIKIEVIPHKRRDQNGLVEQHWQTIVCTYNKQLAKRSTSPYKIDTVFNLKTNY